MAKVIKIVVSDKFFAEHIAGDPETLATQHVSFADGLARMVLGEHFMDTEDIELHTDDIDKDERLTNIVSHSIISALTAKIATEHGKEN